MTQPDKLPPFSLVTELTIGDDVEVVPTGLLVGTRSTASPIYFGRDAFHRVPYPQLKIFNLQSSIFNRLKLQTHP